MDTSASKPRYSLGELLAQCDASAEISVEDREWLDARMVGAELDDPAVVAKQQARSEALKAWEGYSSTGSHVTAEEADNWLAQLEQGNDIDPPKSYK